MATSIRMNIGIKTVYAEAKKTKDGAHRTRILAIASLIEGKSRGEAAKIAGMSVSNLHIWIRRYNQFGLAGLFKKKHTGRKPKFTPEIEQFLKETALRGASFEKDKRVAFRIKDFQQMILEQFGIHYSISALWYALKRLGLSWVSVRQKHPKTDLAAQEEFKKKPLTRLGQYKLSIKTKS